MHGGIGRPQEAGYDRCGSGIHGLAPLGFAHSGGLPLVAEINGEAQAFGGSDRMMGAIIVTPSPTEPRQAWRRSLRYPPFKRRRASAISRSTCRRSPDPFQSDPASG